MAAGNNFKIHIFHYKPGKIIASDSEYIHIWVGKNGAENQKGFIGDDTGENISDKNRYYSELTGLYWVWKNTKSEIVCNCHYRRYFTIVLLSSHRKIGKLFLFFIGLNKKRHELLYVNDSRKWRQNILSLNGIQTLMKDFCL